MTNSTLQLKKEILPKSHYREVITMDYREREREKSFCKQNNTLYMFIKFKKQYLTIYTV